MAGDFDLSSRITADASGLVAAGAQGEAAYEGLDKAQRAAAAGAAALETATERGVQSAERRAQAGGRVNAALDEEVRATRSATTETLGQVVARESASQSAIEAATAEARLSAAVSESERSAAAAALAHLRLEEAQNRVRASTVAAGQATAFAGEQIVGYGRGTINLLDNFGRTEKGLTDQERALRNNGFALRNLGQQFGDFATQVSLGGSVAQAFGAQIGQVGFALSTFESGPLAAVGRFFTGPWGIALTVAAVAFAPLIGKLFETGEATKSLTADQSTLATYLDRTTGKVREQIGYLDLLASAKDNAQKRDEARESYAASRRQFIDVGQSLVGGSGTGGFFSRIGANDNARAGYGQRTTPQLSGAGRDAVENVLTAYSLKTINAADATKRLQTLVDKGIVPPAAVKSLIDAGIQTGTYARQADTLTLNIARVAKATGTATAAQLALVAANTNGAAADTSLADARAKLGAATSAVERAQARLDLTRRTGKAAVDAGTLSLKAYEERVLAGEKAVNVAQAAEEKARKGKTASGQAARQLAADNRDADKAANELAAYNDKLAATFERVLARIDPLTAAAREYAKTLAELAELQEGGFLGGGKGIDLGGGLVINPPSAAALRGGLEAGKALTRAGEDAAADAAGVFRDNAGRTGQDQLDDIVGSIDNMAEASDAASNRFLSLADAAETVGSALSSIFGRGVGGKVAGALDTLLNPGKAEEQNKRLTDSVDKIAKGFGISDEAAGKIGRISGKAIAGATTGAITNSLLEPLGKALGVKTSATGAKIGGAIGSFLPIPGGDIIGSVIGSITGGLFKKTKSGSATITAGGVGTASGNSDSYREAAGQLAGSVSDSLNRIVSTLGGTLGDFSVSIGQRKKKFVVDGSGSGKTKGGGTQSFDTAEEAQAAALANALADGAVAGISAAMQRALRENGDIDKGVAEALKVKEVEGLIGGLGDSLKAQFTSFDQVAADRVRVARAYGLDVLAVERTNAKQRTELVDSILKSRIGSLTDFLNDAKFGDLFEGSATDRRAALQKEIGSVQVQAEAGVDGAADRLAQLEQQLITTTREAFGTAAIEFGTDRANGISAVERVIQMETDRVNAAAATTQAQGASLNALVSGNNETNNLIAITNTRLSDISAALASGGIAAGFNAITARTPLKGVFA